MSWLTMRISSFSPILALAVCLGAPAVASAHPLGNFSINHLSRVSVSSDRVDVRYILDEAEIPTFQQRDVPDAMLLVRKQAEVERKLVLTVDGKRLALRPAGRATIAHPPGAGGLDTTRIELPLSARVTDPRRVELRDESFPGRVGWKAIVAQPGRGTAVRSSVPAGDPTNGLRVYPADLLKSPSDVRFARLDSAPGAGTLTAPDGTNQIDGSSNRSDRGFTKVFGDASAGKGVLLLLLLAAFGWGAVHALSPGHGKAMVAAYLVGTRGRPRHAVALGGMVTLTHTIGVFALGAITLALSQYVLPETLYPWLNLVSGVLVVGIGVTVLRSHLRRRRTVAHTHDHHHHHHHHHHGHDHDHDHGHSHLPQEPGMRGLLGMGAAAGIIPCPSALVVLLGAVAQGQIALGMLLIVAFSAGLAATLTMLGLAVVFASRIVKGMRVPGRLVTALPAASAALIVVVGCVLTAHAIPTLG
ncbi:nickel/cobalt transporter [Solirubrobacter soli]|uniref:nickel/cobalt transporter n=1 Tax=Solirubrobacter soli TaxID=363832 RepID=UPI0012FA2CB8|nr:sulfite exporter TauE/SafE family protein [Solirubrobacter soli]